jgi:hypothetical protein
MSKFKMGGGSPSRKKSLPYPKKLRPSKMKELYKKPKKHSSSQTRKAT